MSSTVFDFSWVGGQVTTNVEKSNGQYKQITPDPNPLFSASGSIELDVGAGDSFDISNILALDITVTGYEFKIKNRNGKPVGTKVTDTPLTLQFTEADLGAGSIFSGTIAQDGLSAALADLWLFNSGGYFGCNDAGCAQSYSESSPFFQPNILVTEVLYSGDDKTNPNYTGNPYLPGFYYDTPEDALASYELTRVAEVPLPAGLPLLLAGLAGLTLVRRR